MKKVLIRTDGNCLGDTIAFFPYFEEYRKKHNCHVMAMVGWQTLFDTTYPDIEFVPWNEKNPPKHDEFIQMRVEMGEKRGQPYQFQAAEQLGLPLVEVRPKISVKVNGNLFGRKYVAIATKSTAQCKFWNYPQGWEILTQWLKDKGYEVVCIDKEDNWGGGVHFNLTPANAKNWTGKYPIEYRVNELVNAEFFIGLGSGLSWLAWGCGKKVAMIAGHSAPDSEFQEDNYRVHNPSVCSNCWGDPKAIWNAGNWTWCPRHEGTIRMFECTSKIPPKMVMDKVDELIADLEAGRTKFAT